MIPTIKNKKERNLIRLKEELQQDYDLTFDPLPTPSSPPINTLIIRTLIQNIQLIINFLKIHQQKTLITR